MMYCLVPLSINISFLVITSPETRHQGKGNAALTNAAHIVFAIMESNPVQHLSLSLPLSLQPLGSFGDWFPSWTDTPSSRPTAPPKRSHTPLPPPLALPLPLCIDANNYDWMDLQIPMDVSEAFGLFCCSPPPLHPLLLPESPLPLLNGD